MLKAPVITLGRRPAASLVVPGLVVFVGEHEIAGNGVGIYSRLNDRFEKIGFNCSRPRPRTNPLQRRLVDSDKDQARIGRGIEWRAHFETKIDRSVFEHLCNTRLLEKCD
jgi:hypothetical protein